MRTAVGFVGLNPNPDYVILCTNVLYIRNFVVLLRGTTLGLLVICFCDLYKVQIIILFSFF